MKSESGFSLAMASQPFQEISWIAVWKRQEKNIIQGDFFQEPQGWLAIAKLKPLSLFISLLLML